jgi:hypothetical protein
LKVSLENSALVFLNSKKYDEVAVQSLSENNSIEFGQIKNFSDLNLFFNPKKFI